MTAAALERDRHHETYNYWRYEGRDWRWFERLFHRIRPVPPVLDVGSGVGFFVECCLRNGVRAVGIELSREGIAESVQRRLPVVRGDLTLPFPFRDDAFGSALAHHVLEHVPLAMERRVLREIRRVLRPGGFLFVASPCVYHPRATEDADHVNLFTPRQLETELRAAGFRRVSFRLTYWHPFWDPDLRMGRVSILIAALLWRLFPMDRRVGVISAFAWK